jgi:hypothetical protein
MLSDPNRPLMARFVLQQCYGLNRPATQAHYRRLSAADMTRVMRE